MDLSRILGAFPTGEAPLPSPIVRTEFRAEVFNRELVEVPGQGFADHLDRDPPSTSPGIDLDVKYRTEGLMIGEKPTIYSPVSGEVLLVGGRDGTVRILDRNGYEHKILHLNLKYEGPFDAPVDPLGKTVEKGDPIGKLGNVLHSRPIIDHVHYSVIAPDGRYLDPKTLSYDETGAVDRSNAGWGSEGGADLGGIRADEGTTYDNTNPPDVSGIA